MFKNTKTNELYESYAWDRDQNKFKYWKKLEKIVSAVDVDAWEEFCNLYIVLIFLKEHIFWIIISENLLSV